MAVIILTDNSFLLNHLDSRALFPFEKSARTHGFDHASWRLFAYILGNLIRRGASGFTVIWDAQETESISRIKPAHAPTPHRLGTPLLCALVSWSLLQAKVSQKPSPKQEINYALHYFFTFIH